MSEELRKAFQDTYDEIHGIQRDLMCAEYALEFVRQESDNGQNASNRNVAVFYNGGSAYQAASDMSRYIRSLGYDVKLFSSEQYDDESQQRDKIIIIGNQKLTADMLSSIELRYKRFGMKYGWDDSICVLWASQSKIIDQLDEFAVYYQNHLNAYAELAELYRIPMQFGKRADVRTSQFDLIWLRFAESGDLDEFLEDEQKITNVNDIARAVFGEPPERENSKVDENPYGDALRYAMANQEDYPVMLMKDHIGDDILRTHRLFRALGVDMAEVCDARIPIEIISEDILYGPSRISDPGKAKEIVFREKMGDWGFITDIKYTPGFDSEEYEKLHSSLLRALTFLSGRYLTSLSIDLWFESVYHSLQETFGLDEEQLHNFCKPSYYWYFCKPTFSSILFSSILLWGDSEVSKLRDKLRELDEYL